jgi:glycosyltransferase involved in cell wall biosynthesis
VNAPSPGPLRILFVTRRHFPTISGMSVYGKNLVEHLVRRGHVVTILAQYRGDELGRRVYGGGPPEKVDGATVIGVESKGEASSGNFEHDIEQLIAEAERVIDADPVDVVHAQYAYPPGVAALEVARRHGRPAVVSIQGGDGHWVGACCDHHRAMVRATILGASSVIVGSASFAREVAEANEVSLDRLRVIPGATDLRRFHPREGFDPGGPVNRLLYHGRVDRRKGVFELVDAFVSTEAAAALELIVSGIGPDLDELRRYCDDIAAGSVRFLGRVPYEECGDVYRLADAFVSPTYMEGFSNTILEAMATGLPIVSTAAVGVIDCLRNGENALLVPPGDVPALRDALSRLLTDAGLRARLASAALDDVRRNYSWDILAPRLEDEYRRARPVQLDPDWRHRVSPDPACRFRAEPHLL